MTPQWVSGQSLSRSAPFRSPATPLSAMESVTGINVNKLRCYIKSNDRNNSKILIACNMPSKVTKSCQTVLFYHSHHVLERREGRVESNLEQEAGIDRGEVIHGDFGDRGVNKYFQRHIQLLTTWEELISPVACCCKACLWLWSVAIVCRPQFYST